MAYGCFCWFEKGNQSSYLKQSPLLVICNSVKTNHGKDLNNIYLTFIKPGNTLRTYFRLQLQPDKSQSRLGEVGSGLREK